MQMKVVFHIDENDKWNLLLSNVKNLINELSDKTFEIEIVANSVAVKEYLIKNSLFSKELKDLSEKGIHICACLNSLKGMQIEQDDIFEFITIVPAGVKELIDKQLCGYAYIKP
ncbi:hypothetical protein EXM22_02175 [Oceanispirochaeta crateris]|uniref:Uncharacterized protein n=1 Tax=Oceanispirochaeta crateris TaxID=2518645 RepID=A0A5C1QK14_9SPIO|nr:DsrE family protein [Oceanispirochaeta crateris]QEN06856.1 hypothetical protein EXM22_02175 [Oceanispirochaeta crateris]